MSFRLPALLAGCTLVLLFSCATVDEQDDFRTRVSQVSSEAFTEADVAAEVRFGREVAARFLGERDGVADQPLQAYINTVGQYLAQFGGRDEIDYYFWVIDSDTVNAYAMPGGYIFINRATLALMENEAELAGVLAHEIAHVTERHIVHALDIRGADSGATLTQLTSGANDALRVALEQATEQALRLLTETGLQHQDEFDADEIGTLIMTQAGYDPLAYSRFLARIAEANGTDELSKTHPSMIERLRYLAAVQQENGLESLNYALMERRFNQNVR